MPSRPPPQEPPSSRFLRRVGDHRAGIYLTVGAALVGPAAGSAAIVGLAGCRSEPEAPPAPTEEALALTGVETVIQQQPDGSYQIADERVVEGAPGRITIIHLDPAAAGGTRTEVLDTPEAYAARLPATPPDSLGLGGAAGSWGEDPSNEQRADNTAPRAGFGLGHVLLMSAMFNMWRPPYYGGYAYAPPPRAFANESVRGRSLNGVRPTLAAAGARGTLATAARTRAASRAAATRAARPTGGTSGAFSRGTGGRSFGG